MAKESSIMIRADREFKKKLEEIKYRRAAEKLDDKPVSLQELTFRMTKFEPLWDILKKARFVKNNKAQYSQFNLFTIIIVAFMAVVFFGGLMWITGQLNTTLHNIGLANEGNSGQAGYSNLTNAADITFGQMNDSIGGLRLVAITLIFSMILGTILVNSLVKVHPAFFFVYILIVVLAVVLAAPISNAYETLLNSNIYDGMLQTFTGANWMLLHLPLVAALVGILGGIFLFINIIRVGNEVSIY